MKRLAAILLLCASLPAGAAPRWFRFTADGVELLTDATAETGAKTLERLLRLRSIFRSAGSRASQPLPVRVLLFRDESGYRPFRPAEAAAAFYQSGAERDTIVMNAADAEANRIVAHEYVHVLLNHSSVALPKWFEEGLAEFYSTLEVSGGKLRIGLPVRNHVRLLAANGWLPAARFFAVDARAPEYSERNRAGMFYAQAWAVVHLLNLGAGYRERTALFFDELSAARPGDPFLPVYGRDAATALRDAENSLSSGRLTAVELPAEIREEVVAGPVSVRPEEVAIARAELFLQLGQDAAAERALEALPPGDSSGLDAGILLASIALKRSAQEAERRFAALLENKQAPAAAYFEYAMLLRDRGAPAAKIDENLLEAVRRNPRLAEAQFILGLRAAAAGRLADAQGRFEIATATLPRQSSFWHAMAVNQNQLGMKEEARASARRALASAAAPHEEEMARAVLRLTEASAATAAAKQPAVRVPDSWKNSKGDARVEGTLRRIDCFGAMARIQLESSGRGVSLLIRDPGAILLGNASSLTFEFRCGPQKPVSIVAEYLKREDEKFATTGDVTSLEFR